MLIKKSQKIEKSKSMDHYWIREFNVFDNISISLMSLLLHIDYLQSIKIIAILPQNYCYKHTLLERANR